MSFFATETSGTLFKKALDLLEQVYTCTDECAGLTGRTALDNIVRRSSGQLMSIFECISAEIAEAVASLESTFSTGKSF